MPTRTFAICPRHVLPDSFAAFLVPCALWSQIYLITVPRTKKETPTAHLFAFLVNPLKLCLLSIHAPGDDHARLEHAYGALVSCHESISHAHPIHRYLVQATRAQMAARLPLNMYPCAQQLSRGGSCASDFCVETDSLTTKCADAVGGAWISRRSHPSAPRG
jgi:hypothetical protein